MKFQCVSCNEKFNNLKNDKCPICKSPRIIELPPIIKSKGTIINENISTENNLSSIWIG